MNELMEMEMEMDEMMEYTVGDECYATVGSRCGGNVFLTLDNGQKAFAYNFSSLTYGQQVICAITKPATGDHCMRAVITHVCDYNMRGGCAAAA